MKLNLKYVIIYRQKFYQFQLFYFRYILIHTLLIPYKELKFIKRYNVTEFKC